MQIQRETSEGSGSGEEGGTWVIGEWWVWLEADRMMGLKEGQVMGTGREPG